MLKREMTSSSSSFFEEEEVKILVKKKKSEAEEINDNKTKPEEEENYSEFDLLDEQMVASIQQFKMNDITENSSEPIRYESMASLDQSQWKIWIDIVKYENEIRLNSIELQLIGYSWPDPTLHAVEFLLFTLNKEDGYSEKICEKKHIPIDGEIVKVGTTFYGRNLMTNSCTINNTRIHLRCDVRQLFKIDNCLIPFGLIVRLLKRRQLNDVPEAKKQRIANKTLIVNNRRFPVNSHHLSICSPVFAAMFESDMKESREEEVEIKYVASSEHFAEFLRALSPNEHFLPNPSNVFAICELADRFQISSLLSKCERILRNCFEIPLTERFFFADKHSMKGYINHLMVTMGRTRLRYFYLANKTTLDTRFDLVVTLLTHISVKMESPSAASPPQQRVYCLSGRSRKKGGQSQRYD